jgi:hypothetical protein
MSSGYSNCLPGSGAVNVMARNLDFELFSFLSNLLKKLSAVFHLEAI